MSVSPHHEHGPHRDTAHQKPLAAGQARDPVCGMSLDPSVAKFRVERDGATTYFCSERCKSKYLADPDKYAIASVAELPASAPQHKVLSTPARCTRRFGVTRLETVRSAG